jgi:5'-3' exonuclease
MTKQTYILIDSQNLFLRVRHGTRAPDADTQFNLALHIVFNSIKKVWQQFDASHLIFCLEGRSWRKDIYPVYKANRKVAAAAKSPVEQAEDTAFFQVMEEFTTWLREHTNVTLLRHPHAEADDMIARWVHLHPHDMHIIISSDGDFQQLVAEHCWIYNGIAGLLYTHTGIYDRDGKIAKNNRGEELAVPDPEWLLFEKCMRGDDGDNVMSAYPGVRKKKLLEAYGDRHNRGYTWNNLMLSKWVDHNDQEHRVRDDYERNRLLIDLDAQPQDLKEKWDETIRTSIIQQPRTQVGIKLMRFCNTHGLVRVEKYHQEYAPCFSSLYTGNLIKDFACSE